MKIPKEIIKKAVSGGWKGWWDNSLGPVKIIDNYSNSVGWEVVALDATFWQALAKACGWYDQPYLCKECGVVGTRTYNHMNDCKTRDRKGNWKDEALRFYDLVLNGKETTDYWTEILK